MNKAERMPMENNLLELALRRRSIRRYTGQPISDQILDEILKVGLSAPTSFGHRAVELVLVRDPETIRRIGACKTMGGSQVNSARALIVVIVHTGDKHQSEFWIEDGAIASAYLLLAIEQYGLGACWVHIRNRLGQHKTSDEEIRALLGVPSGYTVLNLIAIGEKGEQKRAYSEQDLAMDRIHNEIF